ncbi:MAG: DUF1501 domain-containing protein [Pirellulales bacterium]
MLTLWGRAPTNARVCDGVSRRDFLTVGGMLMGGLALPSILRAEAAAGTGRSHKAIINVYLPGGPPHLDMWDIKPDAPAEIRGEFRPIKTNVSGIEIGEMFPRVAAMMDKFVAIRSIVGSSGDHDAFQCMTGHKKSEVAPAGGWPALGAWASKALGNHTPAVPAHVALMYKTGNRTWGEPGTGGFLGMPHAPFRLLGSDAREARSESMTLQGVTLDQLRDRDRLRSALDNFRRQADVAGQMSGIDQFTQQALGILTSSKMADAMDLSQEDPAVLERYGANDPEFQRDGALRMVRNFCVARRLVEAGARVVSMNFSRWDWHGGDGMNFVQGRVDMPLLDQGLSALVTDLHERGLDRDVSVVVWGEFGRTPKLNKMNSRDHWPNVSCALLAGGGMRTGQVIGSTNKYGEEAKDRPVTHQEIFATLYAKAGIDLSTREYDLRGRPYFVVDAGVEPLKEVM